MSGRWPLAIALSVSFGCTGGATLEDLPEGLREAFETEVEIEEYRGLCDASAVAWIDAERFVVANDEDNFLRIYLHSEPRAQELVPLDDFLAVDPKHSEADIEAAARVSDTVYWLTSHGRNKNGKPRPSRLRFFATRWVQGAIETVGRPYDRLLIDLAADERYAVFELEQAARRAPKSPGGLNFEGLSPWTEGALLIGLRNPVPDGLALLIPLENPVDVVHDATVAIFGEPLRLDLDGNGVRSIEPLGGVGFLIAAGSPAGPANRIYFWSGSPDDEPIRVAKPELNVEGMAYRADDGRLILVSDDGTRSVHGGPCKTSPDVADRSFRTLRLRWPQRH